MAMSNRQLNILSSKEYSSEYLADLTRQRWYREAEHAFQNLSSAELAFLAQRLVFHVGSAGTSRAKNLGRIGTSAMKLSVRFFQEGRHAYQATVENRLGEHVENRYNDIADFSREKWDFGRNALGQIQAAYSANRTDTIVHLICLCAGFNAGSGGLGGDGGIPDLDISMFGIGQHRSILTHSIIAGIAVETIAKLTMDSFEVIYKKLPSDHDPLWDILLKHQQRIIKALAQGASVGIAYHLSVDGLAQPAAYHDLPIPMPLADHQALMTANGVVEGMSALGSAETPAPPCDMAQPGNSEFAKPITLGSTLRCINCKYTRRVQQTWLQSVNDHLSRKQQGAVLDTKTLYRLKCTQCGIVGKIEPVAAT